MGISSREDIIRKGFPNLKNFNIIENPTSVYNCIAYAFGDKTKCWWPIISKNNEWWPTTISKELNIKSFTQLLNLYGYKSCGKDINFKQEYEKIALFIIPGINLPSHMAKQKSQDIWESKLGDKELIEHDLNELSRGSYGLIYEIFEKPI